MEIPKMFWILCFSYFTVCYGEMLLTLNGLSSDKGLIVRLSFSSLGFNLKSIKVDLLNF